MINLNTAGKTPCACAGERRGETCTKSHTWRVWGFRSSPRRPWGLAFRNGPELCFQVFVMSCGRRSGRAWGSLSQIVEIAWGWVSIKCTLKGEKMGMFWRSLGNSMWTLYIDLSSALHWSADLAKTGIANFKRHSANSIASYNLIKQRNPKTSYASLTLCIVFMRIWLCVCARVMAHARAMCDGTASKCVCKSGAAKAPREGGEKSEVTA